MTTPVDETRWQTFTPARRVLAVAHNVTAATRLFDVVRLIAEDIRLEVVFTDPGSSAFPAGTDDFLKARGVRRLAWADAAEQRFDLAIAASHGPTLHELDCPLVIIPHGMGYNKYLETGNRKPETGNRKPETGNRKPETGNRKPETGNRSSVCRPTGFSTTAR
ncbi:hypothetical protein [Amycolatopsis sp. cmx-4-83]|uniref:hypothetical protein n=1 Tax=Amycolatopsis sp. cmx-4-83 TaxID=2790940 RepID=UPI00397DFAB0